MKVIICGPAIDEKIEKKLKNASPAAGRFLNNLINGLKYNGYEVSKAIYISYPVTDKTVFLNKNNTSDICIFKDKYVIPSIVKFRKRLMDIVELDDIVIFYNITYPYIGLAQKIKKMKAKPILILADYTEVQEEKNIVRKIISALSKKEFKKFDAVITLADYKKDTFNKNANIKIVRGGINFEYFKNVELPNLKSKLVIMYSGLLSKVTGVDILLEAIKKVKSNNVKFVITGKGELEDIIKEQERRDERIEFYGFLDVNEYYEKLLSSNILINPRNMSIMQNKNNFPSKILEYLATGRVIISSRFSGYNEFDGLINWYDGDADSLAHKIEDIIRIYDSIYISTYKNNRNTAQKYDWNYQARVIMSVLEKGENKSETI